MFTLPTIPGRLTRIPARISPVAGDAVIAVFVVCVIGMVIVPLPTTVLDAMIALNIALSLGLLLVALYVSEPASLAVLPSLLLLATLFRLGLNISTTRLVLLNGDAGRIVEAFGRIVVGGNILVGAVVFLVMALVQFIVIAKGSERVAEVAARFTLDALPGKQMSIDADLRAGSLSLEAAQDRRRALERESQLYGALDGAMKFVKGDAIAGLVIVAINIVGGLAIGVLQRGMSFGTAASHYTVLTVGDGLAAQLPSLLVSTTAGLVVTRVPGDRTGGNLGGDLASQISHQPRALAITAILLGLIACVPGLPTVPFLALAGAAGLAAAACPARTTRSAATRRDVSRTEHDPALVLSGSPPIRVLLGELAHAAVEQRDSGALSARVPAMRLKIAGQLGIRLPEIIVEMSRSLPPSDYQIAPDGVVVARGELPKEPHWVEAPVEELVPFGIDATARPSPFGRSRLAWCEEAAATRARSAGYETGDHTDLVCRHLETAVVSIAADYVGVQETRDMVDALESTHPALVGEVIPRLVSLARLADVLRRLVAERVSIRDLRAIFEAIASGAQHDVEPIELTEIVRANLRRQISGAVAGGRTALPVYLISRRLEQTFRDAVQYSRTGAPVALEPGVADRFIATLAGLESSPRSSSAPRPVLLVQSDIRRHVRALIETELPDLVTLSPLELTPELTIQPLATID